MATVSRFVERKSFICFMRCWHRWSRCVDVYSSFLSCPYKCTIYSLFGLNINSNWNNAIEYIFIITEHKLKRWVKIDCDRIFMTLSVKMTDNEKIWRNLFCKLYLTLWGFQLVHRSHMGKPWSLRTTKIQQFATPLFCSPETSINWKKNIHVQYT